MPSDSLASELLLLSANMAELAEQQSWELLIAAERQRAGLLPLLMQYSRGKVSSTDMRALIKQIQEYDKQTLAYVVPWMKDTQKLIAKLDIASSTP